MSTDYTNITLLGPPQAEVVAWLRNRKIVAYVSPTIDDVTVVYDNELQTHADDLRPMEHPLHLAAKLSAGFACPALFTAVLDDSFFLYSLFVDGEQVDTYAASAGKDPANGNASLLAALFEAGDELPRVQAALQRDFLSATDRHAELAEALVLPPMMVDMGYAYLEEGETPASIEDAGADAEVIFTGDA